MQCSVSASRWTEATGAKEAQAGRDTCSGTILEATRTRREASDGGHSCGTVVERAMSGDAGRSHEMAAVGCFVQVSRAGAVAVADAAVGDAAAAAAAAAAAVAWAQQQACCRASG